MAYYLNKPSFKQIPKAQLIFWIFVRICLIVGMILCFVQGRNKLGGAFIATFVFSHLYDFFQILGKDSFITDVPPISQTMLNIIIFIGMVIGSYFRLFDTAPGFDKGMHVLSGAACAVFGYDLCNIIQRKKGKTSVIVQAMFALMFAITVAAGWEFYEFLMDALHGTNLQLAKKGAETAAFSIAKYRNDYGYLGLFDTMTDMMSNTVGGIIGMIAMIIGRKKHPLKFRDESKSAK